MLTINSRKRGFLMDGKPFFWLGDTAWLLFSKLTGAEIDIYLQNRAAKGFTVIQATLSHFERYAALDGSPAFINDDLSTPDGDSPYWARVERVVQRAADLGLVMALLPCWGSFAKTGKLNEENAPVYGAFLANRFGRYENVLWLLGGDVRNMSEFSEKLVLNPGLLRISQDAECLFGEADTSIVLGAMSNFIDHEVQRCAVAQFGYGCRKLGLRAQGNRGFSGLEVIRKERIAEKAHEFLTVVCFVELHGLCGLLLDFFC